MHLDVHLGLWGSDALHATGLPEMRSKVGSFIIQKMATTLHLEAIYDCPVHEPMNNMEHEALSTSRGRSWYVSWQD